MKTKAKIKEWVIIIAVALVLSFVVRAFISEIYIVDGISMEPTLVDNERILVTKFHKEIADYHRGDIIVVDFTDDYGKEIVKRVIAVAGDTIEVKDKQVIVNGQVVEESYINQHTQGRYNKVTVPAGTVFVMGDNRNHSLDSRDSRIGFVELARIKGKATVVVWPITKWRVLTNRG